MTNFEPCAAEIMRRFSKAAGGEWMEVGGGVAGFLDPDSPVNATKGLDGNIGREELLKIIGFFFDRKKDAVVELAPWMEERLSGDLANLGFERLGEEDLMARQSQSLPDVVEEVQDPDAWSRVLCLSFFGAVNESGLALGKVMYGTSGAVHIGVRQEGALVAGAQLIEVAGVGLLAGDGTIESARGKGLQQLMIRDRIRRAFESGMEWVHCEVMRGSTSQRNYLRCGFSPIYARVHYSKRFSEL